MIFEGGKADLPDLYTAGAAGWVGFEEPPPRRGREDEADREGARHEEQELPAIAALEEEVDEDEAVRENAAARTDDELSDEQDAVHAKERELLESPLHAQDVHRHERDREHE